MSVMITLTAYAVNTQALINQQMQKWKINIYGETIKIAMLNVRGIKITGRREEVEKFMEEHKITILAIIRNTPGSKHKRSQR